MKNEADRNYLRQDGKHYIVAARAGEVLSNQRAQGYTIVVQATFSNLGDMKHYEEKCDAHKGFVKVVGPKMQGIMTVYFEAAVEV